MKPDQPVNIFMRQRGGTYFATCGVGMTRKQASCTSSAEYAARSAAAKFLGIAIERVSVEPGLGDHFHVIDVKEAS